MDNVPYDRWCGDICRILKDNGINEGLILDLACGTGRLTRLLADEGYDMIGIDASADMLSAARKAENAMGHKAFKGDEPRILYLCQDMREFELYGTVRAVICACDSLNYILEPKELCKVFRLVNNYLDPDGIFIFDMNLPVKYEDILSDNTFAENREDCSFIWENSFDALTRLNEFDLTLFIKDGEIYHRYEEIHCQRSYEPDEVRDLLKEAGLDFEMIASDEERFYALSRRI